MKNIIRWLGSSFFILVIVLTTSSLALAQTSPLNVTVLNVDNNNFPSLKAFVTVSDAQGFAITGLTNSAFQISEDNQPVTTFNLSPILNNDQPLAIVLAMDTSESMTGTPLSNSKEAAKKFISTLNPIDQVAIVSFASNPAVVQELTSDKQAITQALDGLKAAVGGETALYEAIVSSTDILKNRAERKVIVLLTDGSQTGTSQFTFDQVVNEAVRWLTPIYPIGFGNVDTNQLARFAQLTGGISQIYPNSDSLTKSFENVLGKLRQQYQLEYTSMLAADGMEHELGVTVNNQNSTSTAVYTFIAKPGQVTITMPDFPEGKEISGQVKFNPSILAPAPVSKLEILIDDKPLKEILAVPFEYTWDSGSVDPGDHLFKFTATDAVGNSGSMLVTLKVIPAVVVTTNLTPDQTVSGKTSVTVNITAPAAINKIVFLVDGQPMKPLSEVTAPPYTVEWDTTTVPPGNHKLLIRATDMNGISGEIEIPVVVEIQDSSTLIWLVVIVVLCGVGILVPLSLRRNKGKRGSTGAGIPSPSGQAGGMAALVEKEGMNPGQRWALVDPETSLGRKRDDNKIHLAGLKASRYHAIIRSKPDGFYLFSLNPENPTFVNGNPAPEELLLHNGDELKAGDSVFIFEAQA